MHSLGDFPESRPSLAIALGNGLCSLAIHVSNVSVAYSLHPVGLPIRQVALLSPSLLRLVLKSSSGLAHYPRNLPVTYQSRAQNSPVLQQPPGFRELTPCCGFHWNKRPAVERNFLHSVYPSDGKGRFGSGSGYFCPNAEPEPRVRFKYFSNLNLNLAFGVQCVRFGVRASSNAEPNLLDCEKLHGHQDIKKLLLKEVEALDSNPILGRTSEAGEIVGPDLNKLELYRQTKLLTEFTKPGSYGVTVHEMGWRSRQLTASLGGGTAKGDLKAAPPHLPGPLPDPLPAAASSPGSKTTYALPLLPCWKTTGVSATGAATDSGGAGTAGDGGAEESGEGAEGTGDGLMRQARPPQTHHKA
ncbi:hypothetical protein B0H14DRAFT_2618260 [Mycena olivaceomarginata]|nr:hypothetical protein B0H14DRAFT_2618260 [Mycena olivaceomarginata]